MLNPEGFMGSVLQLEDISRNIGERVLFEKVNLSLNEGEKAALVGVNGSGKSTLLNLIAGLDSADSGTITTAPGLKISYLSQDPVPEPGLTVIEALFRSENDAVRQILRYEKALLSGDVQRIEAETTEMERRHLWDFENRIKQMLTQLDIHDFEQRTDSLSGGQQKRVALANILLNEPDFLLLDEPTNHLDLGVIEWLENYLQRSRITLLMVTHDRYFLDRVCDTVFEIDRNRVFKYEGSYSRFTELRMARIEQELQDVEKARNLLRKEEEWMRRMPKARGTKSKYRTDNYYQLKEQAQKGRNDKQIRLNVQESRLGSKILVARHVSFAWDGVYYLKDFSYTFSRFEKVGLIGSNGSGKSTFLDLLTGHLKPESGEFETGETIRIGYYRQEGMQFDEQMKVLDAATSIAETVTVGDGSTITASQFLNYFLFPPARQHDAIYKLSGGERRRLYLCQVLMQNPNFLILDEPTNDLDITSLQVLEEYLAEFNGCVLVVSHDRYFMDHVVDHLFTIREKGEIKDFPGNYSAYFESKKSEEKVTETRNASTGPPKKRTGSERANKLSYNEKRELEQLGNEIETLEAEKTKLEQELSSAGLSPDELTEKSERIGILIGLLDEKTDRWIELSDKEG